MPRPGPPDPLPRLARLVVRLVTPRERCDAVEGDLAELRAARAATGRRDLDRALTRDLASLIWSAARRRARSIAAAGVGAVGDVRLALRAMRRQPGDSLLATATLALGIASATTVFSIGDRVLLRPLPYPDPERIFAIEHAPLAAHPSGTLTLSRRVSRLPEIEGAASYVTGSVNLGGGAAVRVPAAGVGPDFFAAMGVPPARGRTFTLDEDRANARVVLVGDRLWRARLGGRPDILGSSLSLNGQPFLVIGVMPPGFAFPVNADVWLPTNADRQMAGAAVAPDSIARTRPGVSASQGQAALDRVNAEDRQRNPDAEPATLRPLHDELAGPVRPTLLLLSVAVALLLLVTCGNVAGLALSRLVTRQPELVLRRALGASPLQLTRLVTIEAATLAAAGALAGVPASFWLIRAFVALSPVALPEFDLAVVDVRMVAVGAVIGAIAAMTIAIVPALAATRVNPAFVLRSTATSTSASSRWRSLLIVGQVAGAVVLITAALATSTTLRQLLDVDPGVRPADGVHVAELMLPLVRYPTQAAVADYFSGLEPALLAAGIPRAAAASFYPGTPVMGVGLGLRASDASPALTEPALFATWVSVSPKYFELMGMPIRAGRTFSQTDRTGAAKVIILSRNAVAKLWPDSDMVIGKQVDVSAFRGKSTRYDVVGVVDDVRFGGPRYQPRGAAYVPFAQEGAYGGISLIVKAGPSPGRIEEQLRSALQSRDAEVPAFGVRSVREAVDQFVARERLALVVCATFAGLTVLLVAIGLYGVLTQSVARRTREIGVRLALGADRGRVLWLVVRDGQRLVAIGLTCGLGVAWLALRALPRLAPDVVAPATSALTVPVGVLVVAGLIAAWMPARRAASVDPLRALKDL